MQETGQANRDSHFLPRRCDASLKPDILPSTCPYPLPTPHVVRVHDIRVCFYILPPLSFHRA